MSAISASTRSWLRRRWRSLRARLPPPPKKARRRRETRLLGSGEGRLAENVMHFARLLRAPGLRIGPDRWVDYITALEMPAASEFPLRREDWYWTMSAVLLSRHKPRKILDQAFHIF